MEARILTVVMLTGFVMGGCEHVVAVKSQVTCAPRSMVVGCLNEAWRDDPAVGLGPWCSGLAAWAKAEGWELGSAVAGGGVVEEREREEAERRKLHEEQHREGQREGEGSHVE